MCVFVSLSLPLSLFLSLSSLSCPCFIIVYASVSVAVAIVTVAPEHILLDTYQRQREREREENEGKSSARHKLQSLEFGTVHLIEWAISKSQYECLIFVSSLLLTSFPFPLVFLLSSLSLHLFLSRSFSCLMHEMYILQRMRKGFFFLPLTLLSDHKAEAIALFDLNDFR